MEVTGQLQSPKRMKGVIMMMGISEGSVQGMEAVGARDSPMRLKLEHKHHFSDPPYLVKHSQEIHRIKIFGG